MKIEGLSCIYKIVNPKGRIYIGQTKDWKTRFSAYYKLQCKNQKLLYNSFVKYGVENHEIVLLIYCTKEEANFYEIHYIDLYKSYHKDGGLNLTKGGTGVILNKRKKSEESENKRIEALKKVMIGRIVTQETRAKISIAHKGKKAPEHTKLAVKEAQSIAVLQYDLSGNFIRKWDSSSDAERALGISVVTIAKCARLNSSKKRAGLFLFRKYVNDNFPLQIEPYEFPKTLESATLKVTNLRTLEETICYGRKDFVAKFNILGRALWRAFEFSNGIFRIKKLKVEILSYDLNSYLNSVTQINNINQ